MKDMDVSSSDSGLEKKDVDLNQDQNYKPSKVSIAHEDQQQQIESNATLLLAEGMLQTFEPTLRQLTQQLNELQ
jgi:hypothetical protein